MISMWPEPSKAADSLTPSIVTRLVTLEEREKCAIYDCGAREHDTSLIKVTTRRERMGLDPHIPVGKTES